MKITVDRIEEGKIVLVFPDGECHNMDIAFCPDAKEGDIINISLDKEETYKAKERIEDKFLKLKKTR